MKNPMFRPFLLAVCVLAGLMLLSLLPEYGFAGWQSKPVDMLGDLKADSATSDDSPATSVIPVPKDSCKPGVTCIADYAADSISNMEMFYAALNEVAHRPVRIAFIGDSFIEADILTDALRDLLQKHYGGCGVGYVPINHVALAARKTVHQHSQGFDMHSAVDEHFDASLPDFSGYYFLPSPHASVELSGNADYSPRLAKADVSQFLLLSRGGSVGLTATMDGAHSKQFTSSPQPGMQMFSAEGPMNRVQWSVSGGGNTVCYAVTMEGSSGIVLDNLSLRGSTGLTLPALSQEHIRRLDALRHYDLVVLQYGLNVMLRGKLDYTAYSNQLIHILHHLQAAMPHTAFLVMGIADRGGKLRTGELGTLPEVSPLLEAQGKAAAATGAAFWNTYEAMGGKGSMVGYAQASPPLAAKDYTHLSEEGGQRIARHLFDAILWGHELYNKKQP